METHHARRFASSLDALKRMIVRATVQDRRLTQGLNRSGAVFDSCVLPAACRECPSFQVETQRIVRLSGDQALDFPLCWSAGTIEHGHANAGIVGEVFVRLEEEPAITRDIPHGDEACGIAPAGVEPLLAALFECALKLRSAELGQRLRR